MTSMDEPMACVSVQDIFDEKKIARVGRACEETHSRTLEVSAPHLDPSEGLRAPSTATRPYFMEFFCEGGGAAGLRLGP